MKEDLLMDNGNKNNLKKPLIYGAAAFLVFIIVVIGIAIFQNSKSNNEIVPAENKPVEVTPKTQTQSDFQPLNVEDENKINKNALIEENTTSNQNIQTANTQTKKPQQSITKQPPKTQINAEEKQNPTQNTKAKPATEVKPQETKVSEKVSKPSHKTKVSTGGKYYIQVAALLRYAKPNKRFLEIIKRNGFNYKFYTTYIMKNGEKVKVTKILVGPFRSKSEAKSALKKVKQKITQNAFIFKVR